MPYFINTYRVPKPGQFTAVAKGVAESLKAIGRLGYVNVPVSPPNPFASSMGVVGTVAGFETLDDVDAFFDRIWGDDMAGMAARDELAAKCDLVNLSVSRIVSPAGDLPDGPVAKIISRIWLEAKPGKGPALVEHLLERREELDLRWKPVVSVPLGGAGGAVRVSIFFESLQGYEDFGDQVAASPRTQELVELITGPPIRGVGRITYWNQP
jgi:hypothetical protein